MGVRHAVTQRAVPVRVCCGRAVGDSDDLNIVAYRVATPRSRAQVLELATLAIPLFASVIWFACLALWT